jgi:acetolactate synthase-1/2/3 large subunit
LKTIILNNNGYHSIRQTQTNIFSSHPLAGVSKENGISFPECEKLAACYGLRYVKIDDISTAEEKIKEFLNFDGPAICEAVVDPTQNFEPKLSSKVLPDGKITSPLLDDMFPFLSREEYQSNKF